MYFCTICIFIYILFNFFAVMIRFIYSLFYILSHIHLLFVLDIFSITQKCSFRARPKLNTTSLKRVIICLILTDPIFVMKSIH